MGLGFLCYLVMIILCLMGTNEVKILLSLPNAIVKAYEGPPQG